ncbi:MAG: hemolysin family protein [Actinobacteria bacterium]|nr:hemolysin family protein [Actinomycetota bacterium]
MDGSSIYLYAWLLVLLMLSALFSSSETAFTALNKAKVRKLKDSKVKGAYLLERLIEDPQRLLSTLLLGNNLVNILIASIATKLATDRFGNAGVGVATGLATLFILIFGEITPKNYAVRHAEKVSLFAAPFIASLSYVFFPIAKIIVSLSNLVLKALGQELIKGQPFLTPDEIKAIVAIGEEEGVIEEEERKMIHSILEFGDTIVKEIMVPRTEMVAIPETTSIKEALELARKEGYSRIPVFSGNIDNIVGILYVKDMIAFVEKGKLDLKVSEIKREPFFVPETKRVDELLKEFQRNKTHMAIVLDEYGGTAGLVTLEDVLEEIVGEIFDEYDFKEEARIEQISENEWIADGKLDIEVIEDYFDVEITEEETETLGGFVSSLLGHVPVPGEKCHFEGYEFEVTSIAGRRVDKVKIRKIEESGDGKGENSDG